MDFEKLAGEAVIALLTLAGTWGVIRAQVSHAGKLDETVKRLEKVTADLQVLMLDIARGGKA